jgi:hypothetical protein
MMIKVGDICMVVDNDFGTKGGLVEVKSICGAFYDSLYLNGRYEGRMFPFRKGEIQLYNNDRTYEDML